MNFKSLFMVLLVVFFVTPSESAEKWKEYKRKHFIIYYREAPFDFVETVANTAEQYYTDITSDLGFRRSKGWNQDDRAKIYIYNNSEDYVTSGKKAGWSHGVASPRDKEIRTFPSAHGFFDSTLPHELAHIIFREFIGFKARVPGWFEEGVAMYQEKAKRWGAHDDVREAITNESFKTLDELSLVRLHSRSSRALVSLFYAESASIVNFLITEYGRQRFVRLCRALEEGRPFAWTLDSVYVRFKNVEALNKAWVRYLND